MAGINQSEPGPAPDLPVDKYHTPEEVAEMLRVKVVTVYRLLRAGRLTAAKVGPLYRISESDLKRFLKG